MTAMSTLADRFVRFAIQHQALRFGEFKTKAGRLSPYFFNAGLFHSGQALHGLCQLYAERLLEAERSQGLHFDMLFGPAYKGIPLVTGTALILAEAGRDIPFCFNRKEAKDHGEGGQLVGAPLKGRVVIMDDVISAGTSVSESVSWIQQAGAEPAAVLIALDRQERDRTSDFSAVQAVTKQYGCPVFSIATLDDIWTYLSATNESGLSPWLAPVAAYREQYGVKAG